jgi:hypothetical protein
MKEKNLTYFLFPELDVIITTIKNELITNYCCSLIKKINFHFTNKIKLEIVKKN